MAGVIPARYHSSRFPGKVLVPIDGIPMVARVYSRATKASCLDSVMVATDSTVVFERLQDMDIPVVMTASHRSGTERVAEVAERGEVTDIFVNIQGDEPFIDPGVIEEAVGNFLRDSRIRMGTVGSTVFHPGDWVNPDVVKVCVDEHGFATDFFRIPGDVDIPTDCYRHVGLYVYTREFLLEFTRMTPTVLEQQRELEQMRAMEHGVPVKVVVTQYDSFGIDTPKDLQRAQEILGIA
ncbi:MAG: 3-deoxy-manno-octulosonate cytidylyltransferase [Fidelibacterota bacterium]